MKSRDWSEADLKTLRREWPTTPDPVAFAIGLGRTYHGVKSRALKMGIKRKFRSNDPWHDKSLIKKLKEWYPTTTNKIIAERLGMTEGQVNARGWKLKLKKTEEFMRTHSAKGYFKKGHNSFNKGRKQTEYMSAEAIKRTAKTRFKKGNIPPNAKEKDGVIVIRKGHTGRNERPSKWIRLSLGKWQELSRYTWEKKYGKIKKGMIITFKDGNPLNCTLKNMEMISRAENALRNSASLNLSNGYVANTLSRIKGGIGLYDMQAREAYLQDKELIELKRTQLLLQRAIKNKSDVKIKRKRNNHRPEKSPVRSN